MSDSPGFVRPPKRLPFPWGWVIRRVENALGRPLKANRILAWSPRLLAGTGLMEALVVHDDPEVHRRLLRLVRLFVSYAASCPFCIDLNGRGHQDDGVSDADVKALQEPEGFKNPRFSPPERAALHYAACITSTPLRFPQSVIDDMRRHFSDRAFTVIAATAAQVNFWTRLIQGLGVQEAGFSADIEVLALDRFRTRRP